MDYGQWKRFLETVSLLLAGAYAWNLFQKLYRSYKGLPPCEPGEMDKVFLDRIRRLEDWRDQVERTTLPRRERWWKKLRRLAGVLRTSLGGG